MTDGIAPPGDYVVLLGTKGGPAIRPGSTMPTSSLLCLSGQRIVVDCGLGVTRGLTDQGMRLQDLAHIFVTHLHSDHYLELGPLIHTAWTAGLKAPVTVWGPKRLAACWNGFLASMKDDIDLRIKDEGRPDIRDLVRFRLLKTGKVAVIGDIEVAALRNVHPPLTDSFALSFRSAARAVVFSGDTAYMPTMADFARGADLLIHEAMLAEALPALVARVGNGDERLMKHLLRSHTTASDAARLAVEAGVSALALNHLVPSDDPAFGEIHWAQAVNRHWHGAFHLGKDGLRIPV